MSCGGTGIARDMFSADEDMEENLWSNELEMPEPSAKVIEWCGSRPKAKVPEAVSRRTRGERRLSGHPEADPLA